MATCRDSFPSTRSRVHCPLFLVSLVSTCFACVCKVLRGPGTWSSPAGGHSQEEGARLRWEGKPPSAEPLILVVRHWGPSRGRVLKGERVLRDWEEDSDPLIDLGGCDFARWCRVRPEVPTERPGGHGGALRRPGSERKPTTAVPGACRALGFTY